MDGMDDEGSFIAFYGSCPLDTFIGFLDFGIPPDREKLAAIFYGKIIIIFDMQNSFQKNATPSCNQPKSMVTCNTNRRCYIC